MVTASQTPYFVVMNATILSTIAGLAFLIGPTALAADSLASLVDQKRPLLLFAKSPSFAPLDKQVDLLRDYRPELRDRDMVVLSTTGSRETSAAIGYVPINRGTARQLRKRFQPDVKGLTVILVGKDGKEKARWLHVVEPQEIFDLVDSMPVRQNDENRQVETQ